MQGRHLVGERLPSKVWLAFAWKWTALSLLALVILALDWEQSWELAQLTYRSGSLILKATRWCQSNKMVMTLIAFQKMSHCFESKQSKQQPWLLTLRSEETKCWWKVHLYVSTMKSCIMGVFPCLGALNSWKRNPRHIHWLIRKQQKQNCSSTVSKGVLIICAYDIEVIEAIRVIGEPQRLLMRNVWRMKASAE